MEKIDLHKCPSVTAILDEVAGQICDSYCKWPDAYKDKKELDLWLECCMDCPLRWIL